MKIPDVELLKIKDPGLLEFMDFAQIILNNGRYEMRVNDAIPGWTANEGEFLCYASGSTQRLYVYFNSQWNYIDFIGTPGVAGGAYWVYNNANDYLECLIDTVVRIQV